MAVPSPGRPYGSLTARGGVPAAVPAGVPSRRRRVARRAGLDMDRPFAEPRARSRGTAIDVGAAPRHRRVPQDAVRVARPATFGMAGQGRGCASVKLADIVSRVRGPDLTVCQTVRQSSVSLPARGGGSEGGAEDEQGPEDLQGEGGLLELAKQLENLSQACKVTGYSRNSFSAGPPAPSILASLERNSITARMVPPRPRGRVKEIAGLLAEKDRFPDFRRQLAVRCPEARDFLRARPTCRSGDLGRAGVPLPALQREPDGPSVNSLLDEL